MSGMRISEAAKQTGLPASTIRYYESEGLVDPAIRGSNGYRTYTDSDLDRLRFLAAAKRLQLGLPQVRQLVAARESALCEHVQRDMRVLVADRLKEIEVQIADLQRLAEDLHRTEQRLNEPSRGGVCTDACACSAIANEVAPPEGATVWSPRAI